MSDEIGFKERTTKEIYEAFPFMEKLNKEDVTTLFFSIVKMMLCKDTELFECVANLMKNKLS